MKRLAATLIVCALAGCAQMQMPPPLSQLLNGASTKPAGPVTIMDFAVPNDAIAARDAELTNALAKAGALAGKQTQPTTVVVNAQPAQFAYLTQAIRVGIPMQRSASVAFENVIVPTGQPTTIQIKVIQQ
ncbi:hypothetical protein [Burkholderia gladioli]|uniref:hypothetical protein n=1 Tax=Burkholderia gladioli TaxID=28095 RepID=UPI001C5D8194|nr:hypothetical protein [Burkholderia gladioli]MBW5287876.1 hypothetical protein [Burkholderia gladioli]